MKEQAEEQEVGEELEEEGIIGEEAMIDEEEGVGFSGSV